MLAAGLPLGLGLGLSPSAGPNMPAAITGLDLDFERGRYASAGAYKRTPPAGSGLTRSGQGWAETRGGLLVPYADGEARIVRGRGLLLEDARTNAVRNAVGVGGTLGSVGFSGVMPTNWIAMTNNGMFVHVLGFGKEDGLDYVDLRFTGTPTAGASNTTYFEASMQVAAVAGETWTWALFHRLIGGDLSNVGDPRLLLQRRTSTGSAVTGSPSSSIVPSAARQRSSLTNTLAGATVAYVHPGLSFTYTAGAPVEFSLRVYGPQLVKAASALSPILTTGAAQTRGADAAAVTAPAGVTGWTAIYNDGLTASGAVSAGGSFDLVAGRPWLNGYLQRLQMA